jgi:hypothetical protein
MMLKIGFYVTESAIFTNAVICKTFISGAETYGAEREFHSRNPAG